MENTGEIDAKPRLLVVDDHQMIADLLAALLSTGGANHVDHACGVGAALQLISANPPYDLVLLDYRLPGVVGLEAFHAIRAANPTGRVALLSGNMEKAAITEAMSAGAAGFLPKNFAAKTLSSAINLILSGIDFVPADLNGFSTTSSQSQHRISGELSQNEKTVLSYLVEGRTNKEIGRELDRSEVTIKMYVRRVCKKLNANNRTQAAMIARDLNLV